MSATRALVTPPSLRWCQDSGRVLVVDDQSGMAVSLAGFDAAVWKWLTLAYPYEKVLHFTEVFLGLQETEARARLNEIIHHWVELGLLVGEEAR